MTTSQSTPLLFSNDKLSSKASLSELKQKRPNGRSPLPNIMVDSSSVLPAKCMSPSTMRPSTPNSLASTPTTARSKRSGSLCIGERVYVEANGLVGTLRYLGPIQVKPGMLWAGIELNTAIGKNDGSVHGIRYFTCPEKHGIFVMACKVSSYYDMIPPSPLPSFSVGVQSAPAHNPAKYRTRTQSSASLKHKISLSHLGKYPQSSPLSTLAIPSPAVTPTRLSADAMDYLQEDDATNVSIGSAEGKADSPVDSFTQGDDDIVPANNQEESTIVGRLRSEVELHIAEKEQLQNQLETLRRQVRSLDEKLSKTKGELSKKTAIVSDLRQATVETIEMFEAAQQRHRSETQSLRQTVEELEAQRDDLRTAGLDAIKAYEGTIAELKKENQTESRRTKEELDQYRQRLEQVEREKEALASEHSQCNHRQSELERVTKRWQETETALGAAQSQLKENHQLHQRMKRESDELLQLRSEHTKLRDSCCTIQDTNTQLTGDLHKAQCRSQDLERQLERLHEQHNKDQHVSRLENAALHRDVCRLESLIESKLFRQSDMMEALNKERAQNQRLRNEMTEMNRNKYGGMDRWTVLLSKYRSSLTPTLTTATTTTRSEDEDEVDEVDDRELYCEICEVSGHDLMSCATVPYPPHSLQKSE